MLYGNLRILRSRLALASKLTLPTGAANTTTANEEEEVENASYKEHGAVQFMFCVLFA